MDTGRLLSGYLAGLVPRLVKVVAGVVILYVGGAVWVATNGLRGSVDPGAVLGTLLGHLTLLFGLLGLGVVYSVIGPAFRRSERAVRKRGRDPDEVPTAIKVGQNPAVYLLQSAVRAGLLVPVAVAIVTVEPLLDAGGPFTMGGVLGAFGTVSLLHLTGAVGTGFVVALVWPYTAGDSSNRRHGGDGGHDGGGFDGGGGDGGE